MIKSSIRKVQYKVTDDLYHVVGGHGLLRIGSAMAATKGVTILTGIALSVLLARGLGPHGYGRYSFALTIAQMLAVPVLAGLPALLMRQAAIYRGQADWSGLRGIIRWSLGFVGLTTGLMVLGAGVYLAFAGYPSSDAGRVYLLALLLVVVLTFMHLASAVLRGFEHPFWGNMPDGFIRPVLLLSFVWSAMMLGVLTSALAMILHVAATCLALAWATWMWLRRCPTAPPGTIPARSRVENRAWLGTLLPLSLINAAAMINSRLDIFMLGTLSTHESVAIYGLATQIASVALIGQTIINAIIGPRIARMYATDDRDALQRLVTYACRLSSAVALAIIVGIAIAGNQTVLYLVGPEYTETIRVTMIISLGYLFSAAMGPVALVLNMTGNERLTMKVVGAAALFNAALNMYLIPLYGPLGAGIATLFSVLLHQSALVVIAQIVLNIRTTLVSWKYT